MPVLTIDVDATLDTMETLSIVLNSAIGVDSQLMLVVKDTRSGGLLFTKKSKSYGGNDYSEMRLNSDGVHLDVYFNESDVNQFNDYTSYELFWMKDTGDNEILCTGDLRLTGGGGGGQEIPDYLLRDNSTDVYEKTIVMEQNSSETLFVIDVPNHDGFWREIYATVIDKGELPNDGMVIEVDGADAVAIHVHTFTPLEPAMSCSLMKPSDSSMPLTKFNRRVIVTISSSASTQCRIRLQIIRQRGINLDSYEG